MGSCSQFEELTGDSKAIRDIRALIAKSSCGNYPVLITGHTGTGKGLVARLLHESGPRAHRPFVSVDCPSLPLTLIESELFGYERGAFTGALQRKEGLFEAARGGTLFLDEVTEFPPDMQAKLLNVLQEKQIRRIGSTSTLPVDVRVIAATNRDVLAAVRGGTFREDLYYRLNTVQIHLPSLSDRREDIPSLALQFLKQFSGGLRRVDAIAPAAIDRLVGYRWPGNVRELENAIERAIALGEQSVIQESDLPTLDASSCASDVSPSETVLPWHLAQHKIILDTLTVTGGDKRKAARLLCIGKTTLYRKLKSYGASA